MVRIIDTTLREGEQAPGVLFDLESRKKILSGLGALGVDEIELGIVCPGNRELEPLCAHMHTRLPQQSFSLWCRCRAEDIKLAAALRPRVLALSIPVSDLHLKEKLGRDRSWAVAAMSRAIHTALKRGIPRVAIGFEDATRAEPDFMLEMCRAAREAGAFRVRLADTVGIATPGTIHALFARLRQVGVELGIHCHNDFGMATANSLTALDSGAGWADATVLGLGERAGNCRLEELLAYLVLRRQDKKYDLEGLRKLSCFVAARAGRTICPDRPVLGSDIFTCETGIHQQGLVACPATYEPYAPEKVGRRRTLAITAKSGRHAVAARLRDLGISGLEQPSLTALTKAVRTFARQKKQALTDQEILHLFAGY